MECFKSVPEYIDRGLGFDVTIVNAPMRLIRGEWVFDLDRKVYRRAVLALVVGALRPLTGRHVRFLRQYMKMTQTQLARELGVTHAAVSQWESSKDDVSDISTANAFALRLYVIENLDPEALSSVLEFIGAIQYDKGALSYNVSDVSSEQAVLTEAIPRGILGTLRKRNLEAAARPEIPLAVVYSATSAEQSACL